MTKTGSIIGHTIDYNGVDVGLTAEVLHDGFTFVIQSSFYVECGATLSSAVKSNLVELCMRPELIHSTLGDAHSVVAIVTDSSVR